MKPFSQILQEANDELGKLNLSYEQLTVELKQAKEKAEKFAQELKDANDEWIAAMKTMASGANITTYLKAEP